MKKNILIIEVDESLLMLETMLLRAKGYDVTGTRNGPEALREMESRRYDLVILDLMLPEMDGLEICRRIKENPVTAFVPVIILTARKGRGDLEAGRKAGADAYITKPFRAATVLETVAELVSR